MASIYYLEILKKFLHFIHISERMTESEIESYGAKGENQKA